MKRDILGRTSVNVGVVGFGGIPIQALSEDEAVDVVRKCYDFGINFYDTARVYTTSEERIGRALEDVRKEVIIATKTVKRTRDGLLEDLGTSLRNLRTDWIDIYQLHMVSTEEDWRRIKGPGGALEGLHEAKMAGKIKYLGVTSHKPDLLLEIIKEDVFDTIMIPYNYLSPAPASRLLPVAQRMNVGTIVMKPFGGGAINNTDTALKYVLANENVDVVIPGMRSKEEVEENVAVASGDLTITPYELGLIEGDRRTLGTRFCRACDYCRPCPQGIPISFVLRAEDQFLKLTGWTPRIVKGMLDAREKVTACTRCGLCEERCPYELHIRELLPEKMESFINRFNYERTQNKMKNSFDMR